MYVQSRQYPTWYAEVEDRNKYRYKYRICTNSEQFCQNDSHSHDMIPATEKQIAHLKACIAAGTFLPYTEDMLKLNYEIY